MAHILNQLVNGDSDSSSDGSFVFVNPLAESSDNSPQGSEIDSADDSYFTAERGVTNEGNGLEMDQHCAEGGGEWDPEEPIEGSDPEEAEGEEWDSEEASEGSHPEEAEGEEWESEEPVEGSDPEEAEGEEWDSEEASEESHPEEADEGEDSPNDSGTVVNIAKTEASSDYEQEATNQHLLDNICASWLADQQLECAKLLAENRSLEEMERNCIGANETVSSLTDYSGGNLSGLTELVNKLYKYSFESLAVARSFRNGQEYIRRRCLSRKQIDQLGWSAWITWQGIGIRLHNDGCLMIVDDNFWATVRVRNSELLNQTTDFAMAKNTLCEQLEIVQVIRDGRITESGAQDKLLVESLKASLVEETFGLDCMHLTHIINTYSGSLKPEKLCEQIANNEFMSEKVRQAVRSLRFSKAYSTSRDVVLERFGYCRPPAPKSTLERRLRDMLKTYSRLYRQQLLKEAPAFMDSALGSLSNERILFVQNHHIQTFYDIKNMISEDEHHKLLVNLTRRWANRLRKTDINDLLSVASQSNEIILFLIQSLMELVDEISSNSDTTASQLLCKSHEAWQSTRISNWKSDSDLENSLQWEYNTLIQLLEYYDLGSVSQNQFFDYNPKITVNTPIISIEKYAWFCMLDNVLRHTLTGEHSYDCYMPMFQAYTQCLSKAVKHLFDLEMFRANTHVMIRFVAHTKTYVEREHRLPIDGQILAKQLERIDEHTFGSCKFQSMLGVFNNYWSIRKGFITQITSHVKQLDVAPLRTALLEIVSVALDKKVSPELTMSFFREFNNFLEELRYYPYDWYTTHICKQDGYISQVLMTILAFVKEQLMKANWKLGNRLCEKHQIRSATELIATLRVLFWHPTDLSAYKESLSEFFFDNWFALFESAMEDSLSEQDLSERLDRVRQAVMVATKNSDARGDTTQTVDVLEE